MFEEIFECPGAQDLSSSRHLHAAQMGALARIAVAV